MNNKLYYKLVFLLIIFIGSETEVGFAQSWKEDSIVVRHILDTNELKHLKVESVVVKKGTGDSARVVSLAILNEPTFKSFTSSLGRLSELEGLLITECPSFTNLPVEIGNLLKLFHIGIAHCGLKNLPNEICKLPALNTISLDYNELSSLPDSFGSIIPVYNAISLSHNKLKAVPNFIMNKSCYPNLCYNNNLVFTQEQCKFYQVNNYKEYFEKYCPVNIKGDKIMTAKRPITRISQIIQRDSHISFFLSEASSIECQIYTLQGKIISTYLFRNLQAGHHSIPQAVSGAGVVMVHFSIPETQHGIVEKVLCR